jgi:hypothetical protein
VIRYQTTFEIKPQPKGVESAIDAKREIRAALHEFSYGRLNSSQQARLAGNLAFINDVEPNFLVRLKMKFGDELIHRLKEIEIVARRRRIRYLALFA